MSKLVFYSYGFAAENKKRNSQKLEIFPIEEAPMVDGEIKHQIDPYKTTLKDETGSTKNLSVKSTLTINCEWLPFGQANRITAPDLRRGSEVIIWKFGDEDKYYWTEARSSQSLRALETVIWRFSGTPKENQTPAADNSYYFEVSTHGKYVHFQNSKANGEKCIITIQINPGEGFLEISDDIGNGISMNSVESKIIAQTSGGTKLILDKNVFALEAPVSGVISAKNNIAIRTKTLSIFANVEHAGSYKKI